MSRNTCIVGLGSFFAWLAFTLSGIALFAPFWYTHKVVGVQYSKGIVMACVEPFEDNSDCEWTFKDTFEDAKDSGKLGLCPIFFLCKIGVSPLN